MINRPLKIKNLKTKLTSMTSLIILSLILHFIMLGGFQLAPEPKPLEDRNVEITLLDQRQAPKQIVQQEKRINDEKDDQAKFLSKFNQRVKKQTRATNTGKFRNAQKGQNGKQAKTQRKKKKLKPRVAGSLPSLQDLSPKFDIEKEYQKDSRARGLSSQTDDHLKELPKGMETILSTREFLYYSYYSRIKGKIRQYWEPIIKKKVAKILRQGRSIASSQDRITKIIIILNDKGILEKVQVLGESGLRDLDSAAVEAFRAAAPFPNPPKGMVEGDGKIRIRWDFILEARNLRGVLKRVAKN